MKKEVCYTKTDKKKRITGETGMKYAVKIRSDVQNIESRYEKGGRG